ncbi:MAG: SHOCT domain-containing protein [Dehalococcoidales bacterium]
MWYMHEGMGWWMVFGGILMLLFWGGLIAFAIWGIRRLTRHNASGSINNPLDIARERYARGEITKAQFEQIKKDLS